MRQVSISFVALALVACGPSTNMMVDSGPPPVDSQVAMLQPALVSTADPPVSCSPAAGMPVDPSCEAPDLSCLGTRSAPAATAEVAVTAAFREAVSGGALAAGAMVDFYPGNAFIETCAAPDCITGTADAMGNVMVMLPGSAWFTYRVREGAATPNTEPVTTIGFSRTAPMAAGMTGESFVSRSSIGLIPTVFGRTRVPMTSVVSGAVYDCQGRAIDNATVHVYRGDTEIVPGAAMTDPFVGYFMGSGPCARCTSADSVAGRFAWANIQASAEPVRLEVEISRAEGMAPEVISCEEIPAVADAVVITTLLPMRNDYPAGSGCGS